MLEWLVSGPLNTTIDIDLNSHDASLITSTYTQFIKITIRELLLYKTIRN